MNRKAFIFALAILLLVGIHACNYHMSLLISGYIGQEISIVSIGIDDNNHEFRVVVKKSQGQYEKTGYFSKNEYGIWQKQPLFCCKDRAIMAGDHESVFRLFRESNMDAGKEKHALYSFNGTGINYRERE